MNGSRSPTWPARSRGRLRRGPGGGVETTGVRVVRLGDVDLAHAVGEGEGYASVAEWRAGHERFWHSAEMRAALGDPDFAVNDDTLVVAQAFRLLEIRVRSHP